MKMANSFCHILPGDGEYGPRHVYQCSEYDDIWKNNPVYNTNIVAPIDPSSLSKLSSISMIKIVWNNRKENQGLIRNNKDVSVLQNGIVIVVIYTPSTEC